MNKNELIQTFFGVLILIFVALIGGGIGYSEGREDLEQELAKSGKAYYVIGPKGEPKFEVGVECHSLPPVEVVVEKSKGKKGK